MNAIRKNVLPSLTEEEAFHSQSVTDYIHKEIDTQQGSISFARYMELALYTPNLGYYCNPKLKLGQRGDFVTAPELSPLFSYCLAKQCQQILNHTSYPYILELGAGSGIMAARCLLELERLGSLPEGYYILEISAHLKQLQQETLLHYCPHLYSRVHWLLSLPTTPFNGIILANEVLDALPCHLFTIENSIVYEKYVGFQDNQFVWQQKLSLNPTFLQEVGKLQEKFQLDNYTSEINLLISPWLHSLYACLQSGIILLIDYGFLDHEYYHWQRNQGTLMCHYKHYAHPDPLILTGIQDITSHINFTLVANSAESAGFKIEGYSSQAAFLLACGLLDYLDSIEGEVEKFTAGQQIKRLTFPGEMGEFFKVMGLSKQCELPLIGFNKVF